MHKRSFSPIRTALVLLIAALGALATRAAQAFEFEGRHALLAQTRDGQRIVLGQVSFTPAGDGRWNYAVEWDAARFSDHFLSMREFKCVQGPGELFCRVPYPYQHPASVSASDLAWLEHELMFLFKLPSEFGAKLWNGLYFRLEPDEKSLIGRAQAIDLNRIASPPAELAKPPYTKALRDDIPAGARWIQSLAIE